MTEPRTEEFANYDDFLMADIRRMSSPEADFGVMWRAGDAMADRWPHWRVSHIRDTGEVYAVQQAAAPATSRVRVLGVVPADDVPAGEVWYRTVNRVLDGWYDRSVNGDFSLSWLVERLRDATEPPPLTSHMCVVRCACMAPEREAPPMQETDLDPSLAFTAQLEVRPGLSTAEGEAWRGAMLAAWYAQDDISNMWDFARRYAADEDEMRAWAATSGKPLRTAVIGRRDSGRPAPREVAAYLPRFYRVTGVTSQAITIEGFDDAGWTMDDYVIPRLGSGMIFARETGPGGQELAG